MICLYCLRSYAYLKKIALQISQFFFYRYRRKSSFSYKVYKHSKLQCSIVYSSPFESIIAGHLDFMEYTKLLITIISTFFHSSCKNWFSSSISDGFRPSKCRLGMDHMFSIGLISGLLLGLLIVSGYFVF